MVSGGVQQRVAEEETMRFKSLARVRGDWPQLLSLAVILVTAAGCGIAGFGGSLQLNITDRQTREPIINVDGGAAGAQLIEIVASAEVAIGTGTARIDRYVLHRTTFGNAIAVAYFLCPKPCADPLSTYLVAYSPDQLFKPDGRLELRFRIVFEDRRSEEMTRMIKIGRAHV
jgi:hypothetical protein